MSKEIPTPYMWSYQPQMGLAAGASVIVGRTPAPGQRAQGRVLAWRPAAVPAFGTRSDAGATLTNAMGR